MKKAAEQNFDLEQSAEFIRDKHPSGSHTAGRYERIEGNPKISPSTLRQWTQVTLDRKLADG